MTARISDRRGDSRQHAGYLLRRQVADRVVGVITEYSCVLVFTFWFGGRASRWQQRAIKCCEQAGGTARKRENLASEANVRNFNLEAALDFFTKATPIKYIQAPFTVSMFAYC